MANLAAEVEILAWVSNDCRPKMCKEDGKQFVLVLTERGPWACSRLSRSRECRRCRIYGINFGRSHSSLTSPSCEDIRSGWRGVWKATVNWQVDVICWLLLRMTI